ncbi:GNAT family N-acetyltransferase [Thiolapillus sp.]
MNDSAFRIRIRKNLKDIPSQDWNALVTGGQPFLRHEFLSAMEEHGCVGEHFGWIPAHVTVYERDRLVAAMPLYRKLNSYGEFVFDHAWEEAWQRAGLNYFPKLVSAVPYTPATGSRLLAIAGREHELYPLLYDSALALARELQASGVHWLFPSPREIGFLQQQQTLLRHDCQFHWRNRGYRDFDDFLARLSARKRKNIRRERRRVKEAGVSLRRLTGHTATDQDWQDFAFFYQRLFDQKWGMPTFNETFFKAVARAMPEQTLLVLADLEGECIAGALMYASDTHLYGRHWGCSVEIDSLHFEACYYQGIDYCIEKGLSVFEPGAQGEHKIARGFTPVQTISAHWIAEPGFVEPIRRFVRLEQGSVAAYMEQLNKQSPYRKDNS